MKFTVPSNELQKALAKVSGVVPSKSTLPILENILFRLSKNVLQLASTDLEVPMSLGGLAGVPFIQEPLAKTAAD